MTLHLTAAIQTARLAAPENAPSLEVSGAASGAMLIGIILATVFITRWKTGKLTDEAKKTLIGAVIMTACLYGAGGIVGDIFSTIRNTGGQVSNTVQQTTVTR